MAWCSKRDANINTPKTKVMHCRPNYRPTLINIFSLPEANIAVSTLIIYTIMHLILCLILGFVLTLGNSEERASWMASSQLSEVCIYVQVHSAST